MNQDQTQDRILMLCKQLHALTCDTDALKAAMSRNWLDEAGQPTPEGREVVKSLMDLGHTRNTMPRLH